MRQSRRWGRGLLGRSDGPRSSRSRSLGWWRRNLSTERWDLLRLFARSVHHASVVLVERDWRKRTLLLGKAVVLNKLILAESLVVDGIDAGLAWKLHGGLSLLLMLLLLLLLLLTVHGIVRGDWGHGSLLEMAGVQALQLGGHVGGSGDAGELLLELALTLSQKVACQLQLLHDAGVHLGILAGVEGWGSQNLLGHGEHLTLAVARIVLTILLASETSTSGSLRHALRILVVVVALSVSISVAPTVLQVVIRSRSRSSGWSLGLCAKSRKHVSAARSRRGVWIDRVFADGAHIGLKGKTQALGIVVAPVVARSVTGSGNAEAIGRKAVKSHLS